MLGASHSHGQASRQAGERVGQGTDGPAVPGTGRSSLTFWRCRLDPAWAACQNGSVPTFAIHCIDKPMQQALRAATRADHLAYLEAALGQVVVAGPLLDEEGTPIGSMLLMTFPDRRAAVAFAASDPYAQAGLFASVAVTAWRQVLPHP